MAVRPLARISVVMTGALLSACADRPGPPGTWRNDDVNASRSVSECAEAGGRVTTHSMTSSGYVFRCEVDSHRVADLDFRQRLAEMRRRFTSDALGTTEQRDAAARELLQLHIERRRVLALPDLSPIATGDLLARLSNEPVEDLTRRAQQANRQQYEALLREELARSQAVRAEVAQLDGRQVTPADVSRLAARQVSATQPDLSREQFRAAVATAEAGIRLELESRRSAYAAASAQRREAELARLAATGLADMPREIALAASENLADARSPFDTRPNWRPEPAALRQEEVRLRNAIVSRMEAERRQADQNARASADATAQRQQADLQRAIEMARADAERERRERQNLRMIELGLGMAAGANRPPSPPSNDGTRTYNVNGRIFNCTTSGTFTNCF